MIRTARFSDASQIAEIYNFYILNDIATFEERPLSEMKMKKRMETVLPDLPWLVFEEGKQVLGYAYANQWNPRSAYRYSAESSVYLRSGEAGKGIGSQLYESLLKHLRDLNFRTVIGGISLPNPASVYLHEKFGYEKVAHFKAVGYKFKKWIDVGYWQLKL